MTVETVGRDLDDLRAQVAGEVLGPDDAGYDERRTVEIGNYDEHPAVVVSVARVEDVTAAVRFAAAHDLPVAVRSGGHSTAGYGSVEGGVVVDVRRLDRVEVDPVARTATAGGGVTAGAFARAVGEHGLVLGLGDTGTVGVSGLALGGGIGLLSRRFGLTVDSLLAAEVVTADGVVRTVDEENEPDLFWGLRGGGADLGVVTSLTFRLQEVPTVLGGMLVLPLTPDVLRGALDVAQAASRDLSVIVNAMAAPPVPFLPPEAHGELVAMVLLAHVGPEAEALRAVDELRALAEPLADQVERLPYAAMLHEEEGPPFRPVAAPATWFADDVPDAAVERVVEWVRTTPAPMRVVQLRPLGGAIADVASDATAYAHRDAPFLAYAAAMTAPGEDLAPLRASVDDLAAGMPGRRPGAAYVNFLPRDGVAGAHDAYPAGTWERLADVKRRYDPTNLLRVNHNVPPA